MSFCLYHTDAFLTLYFSLPFVVHPDAELKMKSHIILIAALVLLTVLDIGWVDTRHDRTTKNDSGRWLNHCMPPDRGIYDFSLNFHQNVQRSELSLKISWYKEVRPKLLQNIPGIMGDNGGKRRKHGAINIGFQSRISFTALFGNMPTSKFKAQPRNAFFATIKCSAARPSIRLLSSAL